MQNQIFSYEFINAGLAFVEGAALILSPCILPILPIVLSGAIEGGNKRSFGIICGFVFTFALFTLFSRALVQHLGLNADILREAAFGVIIIFGIILYSDYLSDKFSAFTQRLTTVGENLSASHERFSFGGGIILGAAISFIWVPCGGPILAAAIVQSAVQKTTWQSFVSFFFFALGSVIPMMIIALMGRKIMGSINMLKTQTALLRKIFGMIIIICALAAFFMSTPTIFAMPQSKGEQPVKPQSEQKLENALQVPYPAPPLQKIDGWINTAPFTLESLKGKVVLIDFWTFSCINCIRTLPYITNWYDKYHHQGFVVIGVHTPEFEFEKNIDNVEKAVLQYQIHYPVVLDNQYGTWQSFHNHYWPAHFLIDKNGRVVYEHFGEGDYDITEHNIVTLLGAKEEAKSISKPDENMILIIRQTPETYLGYARADKFSSTEAAAPDIVKNYQFPESLPKDGWALQGKWEIKADKIIARENGAAIKIHFFAKKVFAVMGSADNTPIKVKVMLDGKLNHILTISNPTLYEVVELDKPSTAMLELVPETEGAQIYTFTFGN